MVHKIQREPPRSSPSGFLIPPFFYWAAHSAQTPRLLYEGKYLDAVGGFLVEDRNVSPLEKTDDLHDGHHLMMIRRDGPRKVLEALLVTQLGTRREERDLFVLGF